MFIRLAALSLLLPLSAFAQTPPIDPIFTGFVKGCVHSPTYAQLERSVCKAQEDRKTGISKCGPGSLSLPESHAKVMDKPTVTSDGPPAKIYGSKMPYSYQDEGAFASYTWNYKPGHVFLGPLNVDQMRLALGHSNGIRYGAVRVSNASSVAGAHKMLADQGIVLQQLKDEQLGQTGTQVVLDPLDKRIWLYCDLSN